MLPRRLPILTVDRNEIGRSRLRHVIYALLINQKIDFKLEKSIFNSGKSLEIH